jgi:transposase
MDSWGQREHCTSWLLYPKNFSAQMTIDEVSLSDGELVTVITNRTAPSVKGRLAAVIAGTSSAGITEVLDKLPASARKKVQEVTMDLAGNMAKAMRDQFPNATQVIDRFHVVRMILDALQHLRVQHRWAAIEQENKAIEEANKHGWSYLPEVFDNGDSLKQLLARSRGLLYKLPNEWSVSQQVRARILFAKYPDIQAAYQHCVRFRKLYEIQRYQNAKMAFMDWVVAGMQQLSQEFNAAIRTILHNIDRILNFFNNRSTNGPAESFNAQIKSLRLFQRGVNDKEMFLFRLEKLYS